MRNIEGGVGAPHGFKAAGVAAGIKVSGKKDLALVYSKTDCLAAGMFTTSAVSAAPVRLSQSNLASGEFWRAVVINSGNANACTGRQGETDALEVNRLAAESLGVPPSAVLVASTGVIGVPLPVKPIEEAIDEAVSVSSRAGGSDAAQAIMTTDAYPKQRAVEFELSGTTVRVGAMAKGAGMIAPELTSSGPASAPHATMLAVITTDAAVESTGDLGKFLRQAVEDSFNCISVDGDASTNDSVFLLANGKAGNRPLVFEPGQADSDAFQKAISTVCLDLAQMIVADGEGATKLITYEVKGAATPGDAKSVAKAVAQSLLVKTAFFGRDPNWGRIMAAIGRSGVALRQESVDVYYGSKSGLQQVVAVGAWAKADAEELKKIMDDREITVTIELGDGDGQAVFYGSDLSYEYVKINAEYHT